MASYRIEWRRSTKRDLKGIPAKQVLKIVRSVENLAANPRPEGCTKLTGSKFAHRIRVGDYRVIYEIFDDQIIIEVVRVGHRKDVYR